MTFKSWQPCLEHWQPQMAYAQFCRLHGPVCREVSLASHRWKMGACSSLTLKEFTGSHKWLEPLNISAVMLLSTLYKQLLCSVMQRSKAPSGACQVGRQSYPHTFCFACWYWNSDQQSRAVPLPSLHHFPSSAAGHWKQILSPSKTQHYIKLHAPGLSFPTIFKTIWGWLGYSRLMMSLPVGLTYSCHSVPGLLDTPSPNSGTLVWSHSENDRWDYLDIWFCHSRINVHRWNLLKNSVRKYCL